MKRINCPLCGTTCIVTMDRPAWFEGNEPVIASHPASPGSSARHIQSFLCLGSGCTVGMAASIAADRDEGVHLRSHP